MTREKGNAGFIRGQVKHPHSKSVSLEQAEAEAENIALRLADASHIVSLSRPTQVVHM